jgi:hypothetical protein
MKFLRNLFSDDPFVAGLARAQFIVLLGAVTLFLIWLVR